MFFRELLIIASAILIMAPSSLSSKEEKVRVFEKRYALIIGNNSYKTIEALDNSVNDAVSLANKLKNLDFSVTLKTDMDSMEAKKALEEFETRIQPGSAVFFYFSGHGIQIDGHNYLVMTDFAIPASKTDNSLKEQIQKYSISLDAVVEIFQKKNVKTNIIILDACRKSPTKELKADGLAALDAPINSLIAFATSPGKVSYSLTKEDKNSLYTKYLLVNIDRENIPVDQMLKKVHKSVYDFSKKVSIEEMKNDSLVQMPWINSSLIDDFYMRLSGPVTLAGDEVGDTTMWYSVKKSSDITKIKEYIEKYPNGMYLLAAKKRISELSRPSKYDSMERKESHRFTISKSEMNKILNSPDFFLRLDAYLADSTNPLEEIQEGVKEKNILAKTWYCALAAHDRYRVGVKIGDAIKVCTDKDVSKTPIGLFLYGRALFFGRGIEENKAKAVTLIKKSASMGCSIAQNFYGDLLSGGYNVSQDNKEAFDWYMKSAKNGYAPAMHNVALAYAQGSGTIQNDFEAVEWYKKAANKGYAWSQNNLAVHIMQGKGATTDATQALKLIQASVAQNNPQGKILLARLYETGVAVGIDRVKAKTLYEEVFHTSSDKDLRAVAEKALENYKSNSW